jgi:hypothetical protein
MSKLTSNLCRTYTNFDKTFKSYSSYFAAFAKKVQTRLKILCFSRRYQRKSETQSMTALFVKVPSFDHAQLVGFAGGEGIVQGYHSEAGIWTYLIEMALGQEPDCGRVGAETMVLLPETELYAV